MVIISLYRKLGYKCRIIPEL